MPAHQHRGPSDRDRFLAAHPRLVHITHRANLAGILAHGIVPADRRGELTADTTPQAGLHRPPPVFVGLDPRPGCVYLGSERIWQQGFLYELVGFEDDSVSVFVDTAKLDLGKLLPDEDNFTYTTGVAVDPVEFGIEPHIDGEDTGLWAHRVDLGSQPGIFDASWEQRPTCCYEGPVPLDAIVEVVDGFGEPDC
jgi:hypothetical protein